MSHIIINTENGRLVFFITYNLAFVAALAIFIFRNRRRSNSLIKTLIVAATGTLFFVLGMKFFSLDLDGLKGFISGNGLPQIHEKNFLGGVIGLIAGVILASRWLRLKRGVLDDFAIALPLGMAIHRVGCLFTGCCFGIPSTMPWTVCYSAGSQAYWAHYCDPAFSGIFSLPVHPVQAYEIILCVAIAMVVWKTIPRFHAPGNPFRFSMILYGISWFTLEFLRDPRGVYVGSEDFIGLRMIQWYLLLSVVVLTIILVLKERSLANRETKETTIKEAGFSRIIALAAVILLVLIFVHNQIDLMDQQLVWMIMFPVCAMCGWRMFSKITIPRLRLASVLVLISGLLLMSQIPMPSGKDEKVRYTEIGVTGMWNGFTNTVNKAVNSHDDCGRMHYDFGPPEKHRHNLWNVGMHYSINNIYSENRQRGFYLNGFMGVDNETGLTKPYRGTHFTGAINPGGRFNFNFLEIRVGMWLGSFSMAGAMNDFNDPGNTLVRMAGLQSDEKDKKGEYKGNFETLHLFPQLGLRLGTPDVFFVNVHLADLSPAMTAPDLFRGGIGTGFGKKDGSALEFGYSTNGFYLDGALTVKKKYQISAYFSNNLGMKFSSTSNNTYASIGFHYKLDFQTLKRSKPARKSGKIQDH